MQDKSELFNELTNSGVLSEDKVSTPEINMEIKELVAFEDINEEDALAFLNLAAETYSPHVLLAAWDNAFQKEIIRSGRNPLSVNNSYHQAPHVHETAAKEPKKFIICTVENKKNYINELLFNKEEGRWVTNRKELDYQLEENPSTVIITPDKLFAIYNNLLPMLDPAIIKEEQRLRHFSIDQIESISRLADYFKSDTKQSMEQHKSIYENLLIKLLKKNSLIRTGEQSRYNKMKEKCYYMLTSYYITEGYKENQINETMLKTAFNYLKELTALLTTLSIDHEDAVRLANRIFLLIQGQAEGKKTSLAVKIVLGNDVIKDLLMNTSYDVFKSIAMAIGAQYQKGFNDGKMFAQNKDGLQNTGMFSTTTLNEEHTSSSSYEYSDRQVSHN